MNTHPIKWTGTSQSPQENYEKKTVMKLPVHFHMDLSTTVDSVIVIFTLFRNTNVIFNSHRCAKASL